jgi:hypothetical protein
LETPVSPREKYQLGGNEVKPKLIATILLGTALSAIMLAQTPAKTQDPIRIFLTAGSTSQTGDVLEVLRDKCTNVNITIAQDRADYFLEASNNPPSVRYVLFDKSGDAVFLAAPRRPDNAVKDICQYLRRIK